jgi:hypothetical protein
MSLVDRSLFVKFATPSSRTPEMTVTVKAGDTEETYRTPRGFRLDQYVAYRHPDKNVQVKYFSVPGRKVQGLEIAVEDPKTKAVVETHKAVPDPGQGEK